FISIWLSQKEGVDTFNLIFGINAGILLLAGFLFGWDKALYSIIFQFASTQVLHIMYKKYQQNTLFIITEKSAEVTEMIYRLTHHGATIINGEGAYEHSEREIVYSIVSSAECKKVVEQVRKIDENAFINVMKTERVEGYFYQMPNE
ncbi:MAG: YitT family protein, partial [Lachnospiraceae bacterium]|nr:YitT family protein [Lachnospiraceae bacterium]